MTINQTAQYGLRAMAQLAIMPQGSYVKAEDLSRETGIPRHYISKIMRRLVSAGVVIAQKGHGGGFMLAHAAKNIRFYDVLSALDCTPDVEHCVFGWPSCDLDNPCLLHNSWSSMTEAFHRWSKETTLADVQADALPWEDAPGF